MNRFTNILATLLFSGSSLSLAIRAAEPISIFQPGTRILFQGDSITDGNRGRSEDPNHILGHGYVFIIAAQFGAGFSELNLTFINRGVSGNKVTDLEKRWQRDAIDLKPDNPNMCASCSSLAEWHGGGEPAECGPGCHAAGR